MKFLQYIYTITKNYIQLTVILVTEEKEKELDQIIFIPFAPTRITPIQGSLDGRPNELVGFSVMSNGVNLCNITRYSPLQNKQVDNQFILVNNGEYQDQKFEDMLEVFMSHTGYTDSATKPSLTQWGDIEGSLTNQSDLGNVLSQKGSRSPKLFLDKNHSELREILLIEDGNILDKRTVLCYMLGVDFNGIQLDTTKKYTLLIDRYRPKKMKKRVQVFDADGNVIDEYRIYQKGRFAHELQNDCNTNRRRNEVPLDVEKLISMDHKWFMEFGQENYFNFYSFPAPTGLKRKSFRKLCGLRLRIESEKEMVETDYIGFFEITGNKLPRMAKEGFEKARYDGVVSIRIKQN
jgi:hypothetical protein